MERSYWNIFKVLAILLFLCNISAASNLQYNKNLRERRISQANAAVAEVPLLIIWNLDNNLSVAEEESLWSRKRLCSEKHSSLCLDLSTGKCIEVLVGSDY